MAGIKVTIDASTTAEVTVAAGTSFAGFSVLLSGGVAPAQVTAAAPYELVFDPIPAGTYNAMIQGVDQNGKPLGAAFTTDSVTVEADQTITIPVVASAVLSVQ
ncbi:MAG: hypothetical protein ACRYG5_06640 [Janthinobacterium lividum]